MAATCPAVVMIVFLGELWTPAREEEKEDNGGGKHTIGKAVCLGQDGLPHYLCWLACLPARQALVLLLNKDQIVKKNNGIISGWHHCHILPSRRKGCGLLCLTVQQYYLPVPCSWATKPMSVFWALWAATQRKVRHVVW